MKWWVITGEGWDLFLVRLDGDGSGGAGGANIGCTEAGNTAGVTGGSSFMSGRIGWLGGQDTMTEEGTE